jgi:general secretion pathway protein A
MYKRFFGLHSSPFNVNPDPRFLFLTRSAQEALASLTYGIQTRKGFVLLAGEVGTGKTTLINKLLDWLRQRKFATSFVFNSQVNVPQFLDLMTADFGLDCANLEKSRILLKLNSWLLDRHRAGETAVLIVDEAQNLSTEVLEEIRLLTNLETSTEKLLQIVLSGQPELEEKLRLPQLRQLSQRITLRCRTQPLTEAETGHYIESRLRIAGASGAQIFSPEAARRVHAHTRGIPRLMNVLCEHCLISAYVDHNPRISPEIVDRVANELEMEASSSLYAPQADQATVAEMMRQIATLNERLRQLTDETKQPVAKGED